MRRAFLLVVALLVALALAGGLWLAGRWNARAPDDAVAVTVMVPRGASLALAARRLERAGAIDNARLFTRAAGVLGPARRIQFGEYAIPRGAGWAQILAQLQAGRVVQRFVTIPEGMVSSMVAERLLAEPMLSGPVAVPLEGSVLPDTYAFQRGEPRAAVVARMTAAMERTLVELWRARKPSSAVTTPAEAVILASIIEKETSLARERRAVAGVYSNRLRIGMKLDADPTFIYPVTGGRPTGLPVPIAARSAINGHNTYTRIGLPVGPIANPGRASIAAALDPERHDYIYFVADGGGGHVFARTLAEHNANHARWRVIRAGRGG